MLYSNLKNRKAWCYATAGGQFLFFLVVFLGVSFGSTYITTKESTDKEIEFISKYEKYIVLSSSIYMIVPFAFSTFLLFGLFHRNAKVIKVFLIASAVNAAIIFIVDLGSGIYLAIKGTDYIAYSLISLTIVCELILLHGILLIRSSSEIFTNKNLIHSEHDKDIEQN